MITPLTPALPPVGAGAIAMGRDQESGKYQHFSGPVIHRNYYRERKINDIFPEPVIRPNRNRGEPMRRGRSPREHQIQIPSGIFHRKDILERGPAVSSPQTKGGNTPWKQKS